MSDMNVVVLHGRLTGDPKLSFLPSQTAVCEFDLASNRRWNKDGQKQEEVMYISCRVYGKQAETLNQYCKKGSPLIISGRLQLDSWEDKNGQKRSKHRVIVERFQFINDGEKREQIINAPPDTKIRYDPPPEAYGKQPDDCPF